MRQFQIEGKMEGGVMDNIMCPVHKLEMQIESYSQDDYQSRELAGSEELSYIDETGNRTFTAPLYKEIKENFTVIYQCVHGCEFICKQETINTTRLNRYLSRQSRK